MSLNLSVDIKELYKQLCPKCKDKLLKLVKIQPDEQSIKKALESA